MAGKPNSAWMETMIAKHGSREAVKEHMQSIGAVGGKRGSTGGFYANRELARIAGAKGGAKSKRTKKRLEPVNTITEEAMQYEEDIDTENQNQGGGVRKLWERAFKK